jgi:hypothetical protein
MGLEDGRLGLEQQATRDGGSGIPVEESDERTRLWLWDRSDDGGGWIPYEEGLPRLGCFTDKAPKKQEGEGRKTLVRVEQSRADGLAGTRDDDAEGEWEGEGDGEGAKQAGGACCTKALLSVRRSYKYDLALGSVVE